MKNPSKSNSELLEELSLMHKRIEELEQAEDSLRDERERLELAMQAGGYGFWDWNLMTNEAYFSPLYYTMLGYEPGEFPANLESWLNLLHPDDRTEVVPRITHYVENARSYEEEFRLKCKDGSWKWISGRGKIFKKDAAGILYRAIGVHIDIDKRKKTEESLQISEVNYRELVENANSVILRMDKTGRITFFNEFAQSFFGYSIKEILGRNVVGTIVPEKETTGRNLSSMITDIGKYPNNYITNENENIRKSGERVWIFWTNKPIYNQHGDVEEILCIGHDITKRKQAEDALNISEKRFRTFFNLPVVGFAITSADGKWMHYNDKLCQILGYSKDELKNKTWMEITPPEDLKKENILFEDVKSGKLSAADVTKRYIHKNGSMVDAFVSTRVIRNPDGSIAYFASIIQDITARKKAEEEIIIERQKLKTLSDNAPFGMALIDKYGTFTYINKKFNTMFGYDLLDIPNGRTWFRKAYPNSDYRHSVMSAWAEDMREATPGEKRPRTFNVTCKDLTQKTINFITSLLFAGNYLMTCEDITEKRSLESQLRQAQKTEAISILAGGIAHDFNNILTAIMGYATLMQIKLDKSDILQSYIDQILSSSQKAADLTQSLLAFSRQQPSHLTPMDINNAIKSSKKLLKRLLTEDIEFRTSFTEYETTVMADKSQIDQILFNIVVNARDAMQKAGGILTIETDITTIDKEYAIFHGFVKQGSYVLIRISDTGTGMDEVTLEKIFDPFFTTKEIGKGTGLGLATAYGIVKQHNGYILVDSKPGNGTTFNIYLPLLSEKTDQKQNETVSPLMGKETLFIAEDNEEVRNFIIEALKKYGYKVIDASDGDDAIYKFKQHSEIDLAIIDSVMPKKNGSEVYEEIKKIKPDIKVLFMSGYTRDTVIEKGIEGKELNFIAKPLSLNELLQKIRKVLAR